MGMNLFGKGFLWYNDNQITLWKLSGYILWEEKRK
jgi:hypothetical protein